MQNSPIVIKNYLADHLAPQGIINEEPADLKWLRQSMQLLVYQCLDLITQQYSRIKTKQEKENSEKQYNESTFLGLMYQSNLGLFELDVYAYLTNNRYKYIVIKNDNH